MEIEKHKYRLFGRSRGRNKKNNDIKIYLKDIEEFKISKLSKNKKYILDIGTGYGETSIFLSNEYKNHTVIACEKYVNGNINLISSIRKKNINNIFIYNGNVNEFLDENKIDNYFDYVFIFFPDPWPKKKHRKRRLLSKIFLKKIYKYINPGGKIYIATDSPSYFLDIVMNIYILRKVYEWYNSKETNLSIKDYFDIETKFYKKAIICGINPSLFILKKI